MKGLTVDILKPQHGDSSNGGLSSKCGRAVMVGKGIPEIFEATDDCPAVEIVERIVCGKPYLTAYPVKAAPQHQTLYMFGGCFIWSCDGRFRDIAEYPVPLHDRSETWEQYETLSK
jgi:hypothetical protein